MGVSPVHTTTIFFLTFILNWTFCFLLLLTYIFCMISMSVCIFSLTFVSSLTNILTFLSFFRKKILIYLYFLYSFYVYSCVLVCLCLPHVFRSSQRTKQHDAMWHRNRTQASASTINALNHGVISLPTSFVISFCIFKNLFMALSRSMIQLQPGSVLMSVAFLPLKDMRKSETCVAAWSLIIVCEPWGCLGPCCSQRSCPPMVWL